MRENRRTQLLIGSTNPGKIREMKEALEGLSMEFLSPSDLPSIGASPEETGTSFSENAALKARFYLEHSGLPTVADDSGIIVEALEGELGIHTRRWGAGPEASDEEWIEHFLERMHKEKNKRARFVCHLAHVDAHGALHTFEGTCEGVMTDALEASYLPGLPISACFKPLEADLVYAAMSIEQKNYTSHRGRALRAFRFFLEQ